MSVVFLITSFCFIKHLQGDDNADILDSTDGPQEEASNRGATMSASSGQKREPSPTNQSGDSHVDKSPVPIVQEEDDIQSVVEQQLGDLTLKSDSEEKSVSVADACVSGMTGPKSGETLIDKLYSVPSSGRYSSQPVPKISKEEYKLCRTCKVCYQWSNR